MVDLTSGMATEAAKPFNAPILFVHLDVSGDPVWAWTGTKSVTLTIASDPLLSGGQVFIGAGHIGQVGDVVHGSDGSIAEVTLTLEQVDFTDPDAADFVNDPSKWSQRLAVLWMGFYSDATGTIVADPVRLGTMRMTHVAMADGSASTISVTLQAKSGADGLRASGWLLADAHQQTFYSGDLALQFVPQLAAKQLRFGAPDNTVRGGSEVIQRTDNGGYTDYR